MHRVAPTDFDEQIPLPLDLNAVGFFHPCSMTVARCGTPEVTVHAKASADPREQPLSEGLLEPEAVAEARAQPSP